MRLIILLALLIGVLYSIHLLVMDYQSLMGPKLFRFLIKRDTNYQNITIPHVRWKKILRHDPIQCARLLYCDVGARPANSDVRKGFSLMISLESPKDEESSHAEFMKAFELGKNSQDPERCKAAFRSCPFSGLVLFEMVQYLLTLQEPLVI